MVNHNLKNRVLGKHLPIDQQKRKLRLQFSQLRRELSTERRQIGEKAALEKLSTFLLDFPTVLSYESFGSEFSTKQINFWLASQKKLILPKTEGAELKLFVMNEYPYQLAVNRWGMHEPDPHSCPEIPLKEITAVLVPGLAFDNDGYRLGYGKGFYDRLLARFFPEIPLYGLGFREQKIKGKLPRMAHDIRLTELLLF